VKPIRVLRRSRRPICLLGTPEGLALSSPVQVCGVNLLSTESIPSVSYEVLVQDLRFYAVVGVVDEHPLPGRKWGANFEYVCTSFYVTSFRPLVLNLLGRVDDNNLRIVAGMLQKAYESGVVKEPALAISS
jgi:hypothetical protein